MSEFPCARCGQPLSLEDASGGGVLCGLCGADECSKVPMTRDIGYLCEGGQQCEHGVDSTHWQAKAPANDAVSCPWCGTLGWQTGTTCTTCRCG